MGISTFMNKLLEFKVALGNLYQWFSNGFQLDQEAARTFGRLALQEGKHANLIRYQKRLLGANASVIPAREGCFDDVERLLEEIDALRNRATPPTLTEALELSIRIERSAAEKLLPAVAAASGCGLSPLFSQLAADDDKHMEMLESLSARGVARKAS